MRIMFYGLQNSGATLLTLFAGQREDSIVLPDLWTMYPAPRLDAHVDACIKVTVTATYPVERHVEAFRPDHVFLVVRRPVDNIASLWRKPFARHDGTPEEKFAIADAHFAAPAAFSDVVAFEDFVADPSVLTGRLAELGWGLPNDAADFPRSALQMEQHIWAVTPELYGQAEWGTGQARVQPLRAIRLGAIEDPDAAAFSRAHAPTMHASYEQRRAAGTLPVAVATLKHTTQDEVALQGQRNYIGNQLGLFESFMRVGDGQAALELAVELCALAPDMSEVWNAQARALEQCGRAGEAEDVLTTAAAAAAPGSAQHVSLRVLLATRAARAGDLDRCVDIAQAVLEDHPGTLGAHQALADVALRQQRFADAERHALAVLEVEPRSLNGRRTYADALFGLGQVEAACDLLRSCLAIAPDFQIAARKLERYAASVAPAASPSGPAGPAPQDGPPHSMPRPA